MALENLFSQMGLGTKQLTDRYSEYTGPAHDQQVYYAYEPSAPAPPLAHVTHVASSKHHYGGGHKSNASMSALTLLAFLFFLHILQQCIKDHMTEMTSPPVMVMTAGREGEETVSKMAVATKKVDKTGATQTVSTDNNFNIYPIDTKHTVFEKYKAKNPYSDGSSNENKLLKINAEEYSPKTDVQNYQYVFKSHANKSSAFPDFVSALDQD